VVAERAGMCEYHVGWCDADIAAAPQCTRDVSRACCRMAIAMRTAAAFIWAAFVKAPIGPNSGKCDPHTVHTTEPQDCLGVTFWP
jgi:hypothetical protein